ncbi:MAG: A24 family peptidase C-terminal domain-containing protein [Thermoprotei archaeon]|jgi:preflagellin peptidase FlaK
MWFQTIEITKIALTFIILILTSYMDIRTREVDDRIWIIYGSIGGMLTIIELMLGYLPLLRVLISAGTGIVLGLALFYALGFGGADAKLIWILGITHIINPMQVLGYKQPIFINPIFIVTILINSIFISISAVFYNLVKNICWYLSGKKLFEGYEKTLLEKILLLLIAYRISKDQLVKDRFAITVENEDETGRKIKLIGHGKIDPREVNFNKIEERVPHINKYETFWVEKPLPFLIFVTGGFITALIFGDISIALVMTIFRRTI